ncbi:hypothetical protein WMY93_024697 [Mugilogobius chulae]|uniref:Calcium homeostasis endoplasmic reticulum protein n=1 Tax=Mugilogobius chulae TaxID=88201 RepID=A0AAW0NBD3_9GOBI
MDIPTPPEDQELRNVIDKLAQFVARNGPEFEKMTMEKQKDNAKFSFLFGGDFFTYYKYRLALEQQPRTSQCTTRSTSRSPSARCPSPGAPPIEELIQQSLWNLQQQEQHLASLRQEQVTAAIALAVEQQTQKLLHETQLDMTEFDNILQPIIDMCTKDAISAGKNWMFTNAKGPAHCELMTSHLRNRITADGAHFELRLHLIYLTNDVLHHWLVNERQRFLQVGIEKTSTNKGRIESERKQEEKRKKQVGGTRESDRERERERKEREREAGETVNK